jgi:hypothetical protein
VTYKAHIMAYIREKLRTAVCISGDPMRCIVKVFDLVGFIVFLMGCVAAFNQYHTGHLCDSPSMMWFAILMAYEAYGVMDTLTRGSSEKEKPWKWVPGQGPRTNPFKLPVPTDCKVGDEFTAKVVVVGPEDTTLIISTGMSLIFGVMTMLTYRWTSTFPVTHCNSSLVTWGHAIVLNNTVMTCACLAIAASVLMDDTFWSSRVDAQKVK